jgi:hypothetical protein
MLIKPLALPKKYNTNTLPGNTSRISKDRSKENKNTNGNS